MKKLSNETIRPFMQLFLIALLQCFQLQISSVKAECLFMFVNPRVYISVFILYSLILFASRWKKALYAGTAFNTAFSIANYYVFAYHRGPLYLSALKSAKTALSVINGYNFKIDLFVILIALLAIPQILIIRKYDYTVPIKAVIAIAGATLIALIIALQTNPYISMPKYCIDNEGFPIAFIRDLTKPRGVIKPDFYEKYSNDRSKKGDATPDIILILDESYSILGMSSKLNVDNAVKGKVVVSNIGGGTNNSEFELLTSNSMKLLYEDAPFNYLPGEVLEKSTVNHLKSLGYETSAFHCAYPESYNRHIAYPKLGFDNIYLGEQYFTKNLYGKRPWLDQDNFEDALGYCRFNGKPQFVYILTYQNHGGYEQNDASYDTVHQTGYGKLTDQVNEYLTSVDMTEDAFLELTKRFSASERPTIICMVGDHNPPFVEEIMKDDLKKREVDYIFWANYDIDFEGGDMTMTDILPVIFNNAGITTNDFLQTTYEAHKAYPVRTTTDILVSNNQKSTYDGNQDILTEYYSKEYDRIRF